MPLTHDGNPILSIHDVGAGGISNAPRTGARRRRWRAHFELREVKIEDRACRRRDLVQRGAGALRAGAAAARLEEFALICERERCPFAVVGEATGETKQLVVADRHFGNKPVDMPTWMRCSASRRA